jgi:hypothetical protein
VNQQPRTDRATHVWRHYLAPLQAAMTRAFLRAYPKWNGMFVGPPYLGCALVCESVIEDAPGLVHAQNIHDSTLVVVAKGQTKTRLARKMA